MQLDDLLRLLRARWYVILAVTGTFVVLTWGLFPARSPAAGAQPFRATVTLVATYGFGTPTTALVPPNELAAYGLMATRGRVPKAVAEQMGVSERDLLARIEATPSAETNSITIAAIDRTSAAAAEVADRITAELVRANAEQFALQRDGARGVLADQVKKLTAEADLLRPLANKDPSAQDALELTMAQLATQRAKITDLDGRAPTPPLRPLGPASTTRLDNVALTDKVRALPVRTFLALLLGLGISVGALVLSDHFDVRLKTKEAIELAFGLPVLAEVPVLPRRWRRSLMVADAPGTAFAESYRILRTSVEVARLGSGGPEATEHEGPRIIVVTSADPHEGKTTTAANLAATFAEAGRFTLLVGGDLRHSDLHEIVRGAQRSEFVPLDRASPDPQPVQLRVTPTDLEHLQTVTMVRPLGHLSVVLPLLARWLVDQRNKSDAVIIVDTPPLLVCNDASELLPVADAVVVVCRVGQTSAEAAERCAEILARLRAKVSGVLMVGASLRAPVKRVYGYGLPEAGGPTERRQHPVEQTVVQNSFASRPSPAANDHPAVDTVSVNGRDVSSPHQLEPVPSSGVSPPRPRQERLDARRPPTSSKRRPRPSKTKRRRR